MIKHNQNIDKITLTEQEKILAKRLVNLAKLRQLTSYSEEALKLNPPLLARHPVFCKMLDRINCYTYFKYGVCLAAIVKHASKDTIGLGFFNAILKCMNHNLKVPEDKIQLKASWPQYYAFWKKELEKLYKLADKIVID